MLIDVIEIDVIFAFLKMPVKDFVYLFIVN